MRIARSMLFDSSVRYMNNSLSEIIRLNEQNASQKTINRPSDDPGGMSRSLDLKTYLTRLDQYDENMNTALGWLQLADDELNQASDVLTRLEELAEQAATGTLTDSQRSMIAEEARELMGQMLAIANTEYAGDSIFAGSMTDTNAYEIGLGATVRDETLSDASFVAFSGSTSSTIYVEFAESGTVGVDEIDYRYTTDGGSTWQTATLAAGDTELDFGTAKAEMLSGSVVTATETPGEGDGTAVWIRPAAYYTGDTEGDETVYHYGSSTVTATADGVFDSSVAIRIASNASLPGPISYSYSLDRGATWVDGNVTSNATFAVPGGFLELASNGGSAVVAGDQFIVEPHSAALYLDIGNSSSVQINSIGADIFGGRVDDNDTSTILDTPANLFESIGKFIGFLETNDQEGIADMIDALSAAHETLSTAQGTIGGREVRVEFAQEAVAMSKESTNANISSIEDADLTQLTTDLARAQYIYESVLSTSSKLMQMSLMDYL
ncbi:flagellar hook-associated protein FlgL [Desulfovibrio mangrovi]|uniref:flagellar hook-associated protein FlgL n=1 Tax=Desulfovibrio mangrovi TaxID=2976983 RepID=UPI0022460204|nr:flagellar hook-associated protein FlgL [Desulfovibrio mangrovi]UZP68782.1 flagellar hook-associated protein FlgL [Desulfovibrio mangrovi]